MKEICTRNDSGFAINVKGRGRQIEMDRVLLETTQWGNVWFDWLTFNHFDRYFLAMDAGLESGESRKKPATRD